MRLKGNVKLIDEWELYIDSGKPYLEYWEWLENQLLKKRKLKINTNKTCTVDKRLLKLDSITGKEIERFTSIDEASKITGIEKKEISKHLALPDEHKNAGGYIWKLIYEQAKL